MFILPGLALMAMLQNAFANTSSSILIAKVSGTIVDVLMAPLAPYEFLIGYVSAAVLRAIIIVASIAVSVFRPVSLVWIM